MAMRVISLLVFLCVLQVATAQLRVGFYNTSCPKAESIVKTVVRLKFRRDVSITAGLLRLHFHDCFVRGCDASLLLDSTPNNRAEKDAGPNFSVRGYDIIDEAKAQLEAACPATVSCSDIISLATRDAVSLSGGPNYIVPTGRRDGRTSRAFEASNTLPGPDIAPRDALQLFEQRNLTLNDLVALLGAHTVGFTHCSFVRDRAFNFQGTGRPDRAMNPELVDFLRRSCASTARDNRVNLDQNTSATVDNSYYKQLLLGKGVLKADQNLGNDGLTRRIVSRFAGNGNIFAQSFADALIKLSGVQVLLGRTGEVRLNCRVVNPPKA